MNWDIYEVDLKEIGDYGPEHFIRIHRSDMPKLLVIRFRNSAFISIVRLAPLNMALCAIADDAPIVGDTFHNFYSKVVTDLDTYKLFCKDLKSAGISRDIVSAQLFGSYFNWGMYAGSASRVFGKNASLLNLHRQAAQIFPHQLIDKVLDYHKKQLDEFRSHAFVIANEDHNAWHDTESRFDKRLRIFRHISPVTYKSNFDYMAALRETCSELNDAIDNPNSALDKIHELSYGYIVRPGASFFIRYLNWSDEMKDLQIKSHELRVKLLEKLILPQTYSNVLHGLSHINEINRSVLKTNLDDFLIHLKSGLESLKLKFESKYPVLKDNPFESIAHHGFEKS